MGAGVSGQNVSCTRQIGRSAEQLGELRRHYQRQQADPILNELFTKQDHKIWRLETCKSETLMTDAELLQHYIQCNRIIHGAQRSPATVVS